MSETIEDRILMGRALVRLTHRQWLTLLSYIEATHDVIGPVEDPVREDDLMTAWRSAREQVFAQATNWDSE